MTFAPAGATTPSAEFLLWVLNSHHVSSSNSVNRGYLVDTTPSTVVDGSFVTLRVFSPWSEDMHVFLVYF